MRAIAAKRRRTSERFIEHLREWSIRNVSRQWIRDHRKVPTMSAGIIIESRIWDSASPKRRREGWKRSRERRASVACLGRRPDEPQSPHESIEAFVQGLAAFVP